MTTPRPGSRAEQRRRTEARILDAATQVFFSAGYDRTTIRAVASAAGVDAGLVMHYFGSKQDLFRRVIDGLPAPHQTRRTPQRRRGAGHPAAASRHALASGLPRPNPGNAAPPQMTSSCTNEAPLPVPWVACPGSAAGMRCVVGVARAGGLAGTAAGRGGVCGWHDRGLLPAWNRPAWRVRCPRPSPPP